VPDNNKDAVGRAAGQLGTFGGVFTPSVLTILGIILFLRLGYVVGATGIARALLIIAIANLISILTSISLSAIATNLRVKGGGDYYLISRTLGVQYGGALGLVLFLAQSVSIAFYAIGFGEVVARMIGSNSPRTPQIVAAVAISLLFILAWLGSDWATRFQYFVMAVASEVPFWVVFALFFPAVTGFTQGVSMSGDLANPGKSLPVGTFSAVGLSFAIYVAVALVLAAAMPGSELVADESGAMRRISSPGWLISAGVIAATLSSALASFLGAPRILQSLAGDRVFPILNAFSVGHGPGNNPRRGVLLSTGIAFATVALGNLNVVAPVVSMFFLISYGLLNYATYFEARANSPSFRPRFRFFHQRLSLAGCLLCLGAMLAINPTAGAIAMALLFAVHQYISRSVLVHRWADSDRSRRFQRVREDLHVISKDLAHPRYWRPVLVALSDDSEKRRRMLQFASWIEGGSGFTTAVRVIRGAGYKARLRREKAQTALQAEIDQGGAPAFARVVVASDPEEALPVLLQSHGLGSVRPNTVLLNWSRDAEEGPTVVLDEHTQTIQRALRFACNVVALSAKPADFAAIEQTRAKARKIDVWYRENATGRLSLLLAYLMTRTTTWQDARIRVFVEAKERDPEQLLEELKQMLEEVRIVADAEVVERVDIRTLVENS